MKSGKVYPVRDRKHRKRGKISNRVYLIGAGPGKHDLITVRGRNILKEADVVIYDYLVNKRILEDAKDGAELICCDKLGKKSYTNGFSAHQDKINALLLKKAKNGKKVVRLKNGDPSIFSRCSQELDALSKRGIEFELIPGITAASAASCLNGIPLTDRRFASNCTFVTGHEDPNKKKSLIDWGAIAKSGTIVLYMAVENLGNIVKQLLMAGKNRNTPVAIIKDVSLPTQKTLTGTLKDIAAKARNKKITPPAVVIVGEVARSEKEFNWLKKNRRVLFTGLSGERFFINGTYFHIPLIKIKPMTDYKEFDHYLRNIRDFDWIVFASRYGAEYFFKRLKAVGYDSRALANIKIAAIGRSTENRLLDFGVSADLVPVKESSDGLIEAFSAGQPEAGPPREEKGKINLKGKKLFMPRSNLADKGLSKRLTELGADVTSSFAYQNVMPEDLPDLDMSNFNEIMFTSPSTVRNFKKRYKKIPTGVAVNCIGDVTLKEAKRCRLLG